MRAGAGDGEPAPRRRVGGRAPQRPERLDRGGDVGAGIRVQLDDRGEELRLQPARQREALDPGEQRADRTDLVERGRVEDHQLLLDAERERLAGAEGVLDHYFLTPWTGRPAASHA